MVDWDSVAVADVGNHGRTGKQAHVPIETLDELGAEVGDQLVFKVRRGEALIQVRHPQEGDFMCPFCRDFFGGGDELAAHIEEEHPDQLPEEPDNGA